VGGGVRPNPTNPLDPHLHFPVGSLICFKRSAKCLKLLILGINCTPLLF